MKKKLVREWFSNGNIKKQYWRVRGKIHGNYYSFYKNGKQRSVLSYVKGKLHGVQEYFWYMGKIFKISEYENGLKHGQTRFYDWDGNIFIDFNYVNGKKDGECIDSRFGSVSNLTYSHGRLHGHARVFDRLSNTIEEGIFINNKKNGSWVTEDSKGRPVRRLCFVNNVLDGRCIEYHIGQKRCIGDYKNGLRHGDFLMYYADGHIEIKARYRNNKPIEWASFDPDGNLKPSNPSDPRR